MVENVSRPDTRGLAEALAHVPGYRPGDPAVSISSLPGGSVNRSYSVSTPEGRYVLRLSQGPDAWLTADRSVERALHAIASRAALAPRIVHATDQYLITEYVFGRLWVEADFAQQQHLERLGVTLRRLHELPAPHSGRFDLLKALEDYANRIGDTSDELASYVDTATAAWRISGAADRPLAIVHHDLHASNLIESSHGLMLIDWECAAVADPLLDVACILSYHEAARPHASLLLRKSGLEEVSSRQLAATVWLFDLHTYLWYRERRLRMTATDAELEAERLLSVRLPTGASGFKSAL